MNTVLQTRDFRNWLLRLKDAKAKAAITNRIRRAEFGNFGDCSPVGSGVSEMKISVGPGYRVYFVKTGKTVYVLLCGGDKKTQKQNIKTALEMASEL